MPHRGPARRGDAMTVPVLEVLGFLFIAGTGGFLILIAWDFNRDLTSMYRRMDRRAARRLARSAPPARDAVHAER